jgi:hypothetical protein
MMAGVVGRCLLVRTAFTSVCVVQYCSCACVSKFMFQMRTCVYMRVYSCECVLSGRARRDN